VKETDLAEKVVKWLVDQGWDVYQEVTTGYGGKRADIVGLQGGLSWIIECKTSLSLSLLEQGWRWIHTANYVSIAIPTVRKRMPGRVVAERIAAHFGIGIIHVGRNVADIKQGPPPVLHRRTHFDISNSCVPEQKTWGAAGNAKAEYWTPFRSTVRGLTRYVTDHPGCTVKEAIEGIQHHYRHDTTARACILKWLRAGVIRGIRIVEGKPLRLELVKEGNI